MSQKKHQIKTLITAYAVNPYKGSEDGTAWNMILQIAKQHQVIAITRKNNQVDIERYLSEQAPEEVQNLQFEYFDLPYYLRFWKKKSRGALLYFYLWQIGLVFFIWRRAFQFDLTHHLNFHCDWMPSFLWLFGKPFVWGPVGHHPKIPKDYILNSGGKKAYLMDRVKWLVKQCFWTFDPFLKITRYKAQKIIAINQSAAEVLAIPTNKLVILPAVAAKPPTPKKQTTKPKFQILSIGRFVPLKGFDICIRSFARFYHQLSANDQSKIQLTLIGRGHMKAKLEQICRDLQIDQAVVFHEWMTQDHLRDYLSAASLFFFPSHEGAGMVVPEALSYNLPVLCFDNDGPGAFINEQAGIKIPYTNYQQSIIDFSIALHEFHQQYQGKKSTQFQAFKHYQKKFTWTYKEQVFRRVYQEVVQQKTPSHLSPLLDKA